MAYLYSLFTGKQNGRYFWSHRERRLTTPFHLFHYFAFYFTSFSCVILKYSLCCFPFIVLSSDRFHMGSKIRDGGRQAKRYWCFFASNLFGNDVFWLPPGCSVYQSFINLALIFVHHNAHIFSLDQNNKFTFQELLLVPPLSIIKYWISQLTWPLQQHMK